MILLFALGLLVFSLLLVRATDVLMVHLRQLAKTTQWGRFAMTGTILALGTTLPELFVGVTAALEGNSSLALGNVVGSNIVDLSLVIGLAGLLGGVIQVKGKFLTRDVFYAFLAGASPMILLFDKTLSRVDGAILLALYAFYSFLIFGRGRGVEKRADDNDDEGARSLLRRLNHRGTRRQFAWIFLGIALLLFSADMLVKLAGLAAAELGIPVFLVGLFLLAIGTSLPELAFGLKAVRNHEGEMIFGDLLGSVVANGTMIMGVASLIQPVRINAFTEYLLATLAFTVIFGLFYLFIKTKKRLDRWEGAVLVLIYLLFAALEFLSS